jgi:CubicO group peptidase (beta-lactamase class C family)
LTILMIVAQLLTATPRTFADGETLYGEAITTARLEIWKALSNGASAATVAIMDDNTIVYSEGFGMRNREESIGVDTSTQFNIGSISKVFTALGVLLLCDDGLVELDKPVTTYLPEFSMEDSRYKEITVRMLLNHSSGIAGTHMRTGFGTQKNSSYVKETLEELAKGNLKHNPGEVSVYCNDGFTVAQAIIEKISGISYADFLRTRVFAPVGMTNSSCYFFDDNPNIAYQYDPATGRVLPKEYVNIMGSGGISSTAEDLCRFSQTLWANPLLEGATLEEFMLPQYGPLTVPGGVPFYRYGLGWDSVELEEFVEQGVKVLAKSGGTIQFNSELYVAPDEKLSVALVFAGPADPATICTKILQAVMESKGILEKAESQGKSTPKVTDMPRELLSYAGYYGNYQGLIKVEFDIGTMAMKYFKYDNGAFVLAAQFPYLEDGFHLDGVQRLTFEEDAGGTRFIVVHVGNSTGEVVFAQEIPQGNSALAGSAFEDKVWLPRNLTSFEFVPFVMTSGILPELPGYIHLDNVPYALVDEYSAAMALSHARDLVEPVITERGGELWLEAGGHLFSDASKIIPFDPYEEVVIGTDGHNEWRLVETDHVLNTKIPMGGRLLVFSSMGELAYDSLTKGEKAVYVEGGSHVGFVGESGSVFVPTHRP